MNGDLYSQIKYRNSLFKESMFNPKIFMVDLKESLIWSSLSLIWSIVAGAIVWAEKVTWGARIEAAGEMVFAAGDIGAEGEIGCLTGATGCTGAWTGDALGCAATGAGCLTGVAGVAGAGRMDGANFA